MTAVTTDNSLPNNNRFYQRAVEAFYRFLERREKYARQKATYIALTRLSERELSDIGITRGDIYSVSRDS